VLATRTRKLGRPKGSKNKTTKGAFPVEEMAVDDRGSGAKRKRQSTLSFRPRGEESKEEEGGGVAL
jgi:hypothetical protein